jgi:hypothetical protein
MAGDAQRVAGAVGRSVARARRANRWFWRSSGRRQIVSKAGPLHSAGGAISPSDARADAGNASTRCGGGRGAQSAADGFSDDTGEDSTTPISFRETPIFLREACATLATSDVPRDESDPFHQDSDDLPATSDVVDWGPT